MKLISNTSYINTNNEIQLLKKYNFLLNTNVISLHTHDDCNCLLTPN